LIWKDMYTKIRYHDGIVLIVFINNKQIVSFRDHSRGLGDFTDEDLGYRIFGTGDATFLSEFGQDNRLYLVHSPKLGRN